MESQSLGVTADRGHTDQPEQEGSSVLRNLLSSAGRKPSRGPQKSSCINI